MMQFGFFAFLFGSILGLFSIPSIWMYRKFHKSRRKKGFKGNVTVLPEADHSMLSVEREEHSANMYR